MGDDIKKNFTFKLCSIWAGEFITESLPLFLQCVNQCPIGAWKAVLNLFKERWNQLPIARYLREEAHNDAKHYFIIDMRCISDDRFVLPDLLLKGVDLISTYNKIVFPSINGVYMQSLVDMLHKCSKHKAVMMLANDGAMHDGLHWFRSQFVEGEDIVYHFPIAFGLGYTCSDCEDLYNCVSDILKRENLCEELTQTLACLDSIAENALLASLVHIKISDSFVDVLMGNRSALIDGSAVFFDPSTKTDVEYITTFLQCAEIKCDDLDVFDSSHFKTLMDVEKIKDLLDKCNRKRMLNLDGIENSVEVLAELYAETYVKMSESRDVKEFPDATERLNRVVVATVNGVYDYFLRFFPAIFELRQIVNGKLPIVPTALMTNEKCLADNALCRKLFYDTLARAKLVVKKLENKEFDQARVWLYKKGFNTELWADQVQILHQQRAPITPLPQPKIIRHRVNTAGAASPASGA
jgi:hypothetical protein